MLSVMYDDDFAVEYCTNMISVHVSAYVIFYDVRILQPLHILHFFYDLQLFFQYCCHGNRSNKQVEITF